MPGLLERIKQRKIGQWSLAYLGASWLILQFLDVVAEPWGVTAGQIRALQVLLAVGLVGTIVLAWYHGEKGRQRVGGTELLVIAGLTLIAGVLVSIVIEPGPTAEPPTTVETIPASTSRPAEPPPFQSLVVLPITNNSPNPSETIVARNLTDELTNQLSKLAGLRVMSTSAAVRLLERGMTPREMAANLGIGARVEGTVTETTERIRVVMRLISTDTEESLWGNEYDREIVDVFALQGELAEQIAASLEVAISAAERGRLGVPPTEDMLAYSLYQRGIEEWASSPAAMERAIGWFRQAFEEDPEFAHAYSAAGLAYGWRVFWGEEALADSARDLVNYGLELAPDDAYTNYRFAITHNLVAHDVEASSNAYARTLEVDPNNTAAMTDLSFNAFLLGRCDDSLFWAERALRRDPSEGGNIFHMSLPLLCLGRNEAARDFLLRNETAEEQHARRLAIKAIFRFLEGDAEGALEELRSALEVYPDDVEVRMLHASVLWYSRSNQALGVLEELVGESEAYLNIFFPVRSMLALYGHELLARGRTAEAAEVLARALESTEAWLALGGRRPWSRAEIAAIHASLGDDEEAIRWLEDAYANGYRLPGLAIDPMFQSLRADPRFIEIVSKIDTDVTEMNARAARQGMGTSLGLQ